MEWRGERNAKRSRNGLAPRPAPEADSGLRAGKGQGLHHARQRHSCCQHTFLWNEPFQGYCHPRQLASQDVGIEIAGLTCFPLPLLALPQCLGLRTAATLVLLIFVSLCSLARPQCLCQRFAATLVLAVTNHGDNRVAYGLPDENVVENTLKHDSVVASAVGKAHMWGHGEGLHAQAPCGADSRQSLVIGRHNVIPDGPHRRRVHSGIGTS